MKTRNIVILAAGLALVMGGTAFAKNDKPTDQNYGTHGAMMGTDGGRYTMGGMHGRFGGDHMQAGTKTARLGALHQTCVGDAGNMMNAPGKPGTPKQKR